MIPDSIKNTVYELEGIAALLDDTEIEENAGRVSELLALAYEKLTEVETRLDHIQKLVNAVSPEENPAPEDSDSADEGPVEQPAPVAETVAVENSEIVLEFTAPEPEDVPAETSEEEVLAEEEVPEEETAEEESAEEESEKEETDEEETGEEESIEEETPEEIHEEQAEIAATAEFEEKQEAHTDVNTRAFVRNIGSAKAAFSLNDTFRFRRELFHGDAEAWQSALADIEDAEDADALRSWLVECYELPVGSPDTEDFLDIAVAYVKGQKG